MVRGDDDERVRGFVFVEGDLHGVGELDRLGQRAIGVARVVAVVDAAALDHQEEALRARASRSIAAAVISASDGSPARVSARSPSNSHVLGLEQAEHVARLPRIERDGAARGSRRRARPGSASATPRRGRGRRRARPGVRALGVDRAPGRKWARPPPSATSMPSPCANSTSWRAMSGKPAARASGDSCASASQLRSGVVGVAAAGRRVGDRRGRDDPGREPAVLGLLEQRRHRRAPSTAAKSPRAALSSTPSTPVRRLHPGHQRRDRARRLGDLEVDGVGLRERRCRAAPRRRAGSPRRLAPRRWPSRMRAAVTVAMPMPSPTKRIAFFARAGGAAAAARFTASRPARNQGFAAGSPARAAPARIASAQSPATPIRVVTMPPPSRPGSWRRDRGRRCRRSARRRLACRRLLRARADRRRAPRRPRPRPRCGCR